MISNVRKAEVVYLTSRLLRPRGQMIYDYLRPFQVFFFRLVSDLISQVCIGSWTTTIYTMVWVNTRF